MVNVYKYRSEMHRNLANFTTIRIALHLFEPHENASPALVFTKGMVLATNHKKLAWNSKEHLPVQGYTSNQDFLVYSKLSLGVRAHRITNRNFEL